MQKVSVENLSEEDIFFLIGEERIPSPGEDFLLPYDINATNVSLGGNRFAGNPIFTFVMEITSAVVANMISTYLYEKLSNLKKGKSINLRINGKNTLIDESSIRENIASTISDSSV